jgi:hypothetical protein
MIGGRLWQIASLAAGVASVGLLVWALWLRSDVAALEEKAASLRRSNAALIEARDQAQLARDVEAARAAREAARASELQSTIDAIQGVPDAPLHPDLIDLLGSRGWELPGAD